MFLKPMPKFCYIFYFMHINEFFRFRLLVSNYFMQTQRAFISSREHLLLFAKIIVSVGKSKFLSLVLFSFFVTHVQLFLFRNGRRLGEKR